VNHITGPDSLALACHPLTPARVIRALDVAACATPGGGLSLNFCLQGDLSGLRIPGPGSSRRADGLWRHTCFEAFVMAGEGPGYREFNFSPSGEWASYDFYGYRDGGKPVAVPGPDITVRRDGERLELDAEVYPESLPPGRSLRLGLSAVVEDVQGGLTYWALRHPEGQPDFHQSNAFTLALDRPVPPGGDTLTGGAKP
jgi:hypothetical protein